MDRQAVETWDGAFLSSWTSAGSGRPRESVLTDGLDMTRSDLSPTSLFHWVVVFFFVILGELFKICILNPSPVWHM